MATVLGLKKQVQLGLVKTDRWAFRENSGVQGVIRVSDSSTGIWKEEMDAKMLQVEGIPGVI